MRLLLIVILFFSVSATAQRKYVVRNGDTTKYSMPYNPNGGVTGVYTERKIDTPRSRGIYGHGVKSIARFKRPKK